MELSDFQCQSPLFPDQDDFEHDAAKTRSVQLWRDWGKGRKWKNNLILFCFCEWATFFSSRRLSQKWFTLLAGATPTFSPKAKLAAAIRAIGWKKCTTCLLLSPSNPEKRGGKNVRYENPICDQGRNSGWRKFFQPNFHTYKFWHTYNTHNTTCTEREIQNSLPFLKWVTLLEWVGFSPSIGPPRLLRLL